METETHEQIVDALTRARILFTRVYIVEGNTLTKQEELAENLLEKAQMLLGIKAEQYA